MKPKMRIQVWDKDNNQTHDRLVDQYTECNMGPKEKVEGLIKLEVGFTEKDDVERVIEYIKKLTGLLPISAKVKKAVGRKPLTAENVEDQRDEILKEAKEHCKDQKDLIKFLREEKNFVLLTTQHMEELGIKLEKADDFAEYQFYFRCIKMAKDPKNDKFDPALAFAIKVIGKPDEQVGIFLFGKFEETWEVPIPKKDFIFKKQEFIKFPHYMTLEEREKWRKEHRELSLKPDKEQSKFYKRWLEHIELPKPVKD